MTEYVWVKFYCDTPRDNKLKGQPTSWKWLWSCLLTLAKESKEQGILPRYQSKAKWLADYAEIPVKDAAAALIYFSDPEIRMAYAPEDGENVGRLVLPNFEKRQGKHPSDEPAKVAARVAKWRATNKSLLNSDVTSSNDTGNDTGNGIHAPARSPEEEDRNPSDYLEKKEEENARGAVLSPSGKTWFDDFWAAYPQKRDGMRWDRSATGKAFAHYVAGAKTALAVQAATNYAKSPAVVNDGVVYAPDRWLSGDWEYWLKPDGKNAKPANPDEGLPEGQHRRPDGGIRTDIGKMRPDGRVQWAI